jgi:hypothetical protein
MLVMSWDEWVLPGAVTGLLLLMDGSLGFRDAGAGALGSGAKGLPPAAQGYILIQNSPMKSHAASPMVNTAGINQRYCHQSRLSEMFLSSFSSLIWSMAPYPLTVMMLGIMMLLFLL